MLNYRTTLAEVYRHATAKRYCAENPFDRFTREDWKNSGGEKAVQDVDSINILMVSEARQLLETALEQSELGLLGNVTLRLFCGLRTTETYRLDWSEVHWADPRPYVHIPAGKAKKKNIRLVNIPENALHWLKLCNPPAKGPVTPQARSIQGYYETFARLVKTAGMGKADAKGKWVSAWENNDTRHSFGSYHYALHGDSMATSRQMGHKQGDDTLFAHYRTLVNKEEAQEYFGILPSVEAEKVTKFPASISG